MSEKVWRNVLIMGTIVSLVALIALMVGCSGSSSTSSGSNSSGSSSGPSGTQVFQQKGCAGCHMVNGQGGKIGPDLSHIGSTPYNDLPNDVASLDKFLKNPASVKSNTTMPSVPLSDAERKALVDYMVSLK